MTFFINILVVIALNISVNFRRDDDFYTQVFGELNNFISIIAFVGDQAGWFEAGYKFFSL